MSLLKRFLGEKAPEPAKPENKGKSAEETRRDLLKAGADRERLWKVEQGAAESRTPESSEYQEQVAEVISAEVADKKAQLEAEIKSLATSLKKEDRVRLKQLRELLAKLSAKQTSGYKQE